jgi:hypothetical protein
VVVFGTVVVVVDVVVVDVVVVDVVVVVVGGETSSPAYRVKPFDKVKT